MENFDDMFNSTSTQENQSFAPFDKEAWAVRKQQERERAFALIDSTAVEIAGSGERFQAYLDVQARFDRYSVGNALLVTAQMPEATQLADFATWKSSGAYVKRGENAITILEPGKEYEREDGSVGVSYDPKKVFDVSQTNSRQRAVPTVARDERLFLKALINNAPCQMTITANLPEHLNVVYHAEDNVILMRQGMDAPAIFRGLSQELARAHLQKSQHDCASPAFTAYCVSYILCRRNGIETEGFKFHRLPETLAEMDPRAIRKELGVIREIANEMSSDMNRVFDAQKRSQQNRSEGAR